MREKRVLSSIIISLSLLLVSCDKTRITREEAIAIIADIAEYHESDDFVLPTKYTTVCTIRNTTPSSESETIVSINYDYEAKYLHVNLTATYEGGSETISEQWFYYETNEDKTYTVADSGYDKFRIETDGDAFADIMSEISSIYLLEDMYGRLDFSSLADYLASDDSRNIYRSEGEGNLYLKYYFESNGLDTWEEIVISNYLIMKMEVTSEQDYLFGFVVNYGVVTIEKPNLDEFPLAV